MGRNQEHLDTLSVCLMGAAFLCMHMELENLNSQCTPPLECQLEVLFPSWTTVLSHWLCSQFYPNGGFKELCLHLQLFELIPQYRKHSSCSLCFTQTICNSSAEGLWEQGNQPVSDGSSQKKVQVALVFPHIHSKNFFSWWNRRE